MATILSLYDSVMRREPLAIPTQRVEKTPFVTRILIDVPGFECGAILYSALDEKNADDVIASEKAYFASQGRALEWKAYDHDSPSDLGERLYAHGFKPSDKESLLYLPLVNWARLPAPAGISIKKTNDVSLLSLEEPLTTELRRELAATPDRLSIYVAWSGAHVAARAWIRFYPGRPFADLWGGETKREFRNRGIYRALVAARAEEAILRGAQYLTTDALPSSRPILEKLGFARLSGTTPYLWLPL